MPNPEWGVKRLCPNCATRFYDLTNDPATCPACESTFSLQALSLKRVKAERNVAPEPVKKAAPVAEEDDEDDVVLDDDDDSDAPDITVGDDVLDDDDAGTEVSLEELGDVPAKEEET